MTAPGYGFPKARRVTRGAELDRLREAGRRVRTRHLDVRVLAGAAGAPARVGIVVPKHRHGSVERNRVKRRLRELARLHLLPAVAHVPVDVWIRARPEAYRATFAELAADVARAGREAARPPGARPPAATPAPGPPSEPPAAG